VIAEGVLSSCRPLVGGAEVIVGELGAVGSPGRLDCPVGVERPFADVTSIGDGDGIALRQRLLQVKAIDRRPQRAGKAADAEVQELAVPRGRQLHLELRRTGRRAFARRLERAEHVAIGGIGQCGGDLRRRGDGGVGYVERRNGLSGAARSGASRPRGHGHAHHGNNGNARGQIAERRACAPDVWLVSHATSPSYVLEIVRHTSTVWRTDVKN
jgi:hypothetical protein